MLEGARWLGSADWRDSIRPVDARPYALRGSWELGSIREHAIMHVSGSPRFVLWINGRRVHEGPGRSFPTRQLVDEIDVGSFLQAGVNSLAVLLLPGSGAVDYQVPGRTAFIASLCCGDEDFITEAGWLGQPADWYIDGQRWISIAVGAQEHLQQEAEPAGWQTCALDELDERWAPARVLGGAGTPPFDRLEARPQALLEDRPCEPELVWVGQADGLIPDQSSVNDSHWFDDLEFKGGATRGHHLRRLTPDLGNAFTFDLGRTRLVRPQLLVAGVQGPLRIWCCYSLCFDGRPHCDAGFGSSREGMVDSITVNAGDVGWDLLEARGFRYLTILVSGTGDWSDLELTLFERFYPYKEAANLTVGDHCWRDLWQISRTNIQASSSDVLVDTCAREHVCWTMDAVHTGLASFHATGDASLWRRSLDLIGQGVDAQGHGCAVVPSASFTCLPDQTMHWIWGLRQYWLHLGEREFLLQQLPAVQRFLVWCADCLSDDDVYVPPSWCWQWVDWAALEKRSYAAPINFLLAFAVTEARALADDLEQAELAEVCKKLYTRLRSGCERFFVEGGIRDHVPAPEAVAAHDNHTSFHARSDMAPCSLHSTVFANLAGLGTRPQRQQALLQALELVQRGEPSELLGPGSVRLLLTPLCDAGYQAAVQRFIHRAYDPWRHQGVPTWPERFGVDPSAGNTAHGWGASVVSLLIDGYLGLRPTGPGWSRAAFKPTLDQAPDLHYRLETPAGPIEVFHEAGRWSVQASRQIDLAIADPEVIVIQS